MTGLGLGESPRWHDGRLWFAHWGAQEIVAVDLDGDSEVVAAARRPGYSIDWLPDGRLLIVERARACCAGSPTGRFTHADLSRLADGWNEIVVDGRGNVYVNGRLRLHGRRGVPPGIIALVTPDGAVRQVADDIAFPNGMAVTPDNSTLIVAESFAGRLTAFDIAADGSLSNRRVWADLGERRPDGICLDAEGAVWYGRTSRRRAACASARAARCCERIGLDRVCFACMLGGEDRRTLFMLAAEWRGTENIGKGTRTGKVLTVRAPAPGPASVARGRE